MRSIRRLPAALALVSLAAWMGCGPHSPKSETQEGGAQGPRVENPTLGLALTHVPAGFTVARNQGGDLVLERSAPDDHGRLTILVGPAQTAGVNLVDQVWKEKARFEGLPDGKFMGQNELGGAALGTVYTTRGRYTDEQGQAMEDYRALAVHPSENRLLTLDYQYPAPAPGTSPQGRLEQLMLVVEQVEGLGGPSASGS